jgi:hypothetical protein
LQNSPDDRSPPKGRPVEVSNLLRISGALPSRDRMPGAERSFGEFCKWLGVLIPHLMGVSERLMFEAPVKGETGAAGLSEMARGKLKKKAEPRKVPPD